jgi:hypothetical protein
MQVDVNSSPPEMTVLVHSASSEEAIPDEKGIRIVRQARSQIAEHARNVFVLVSATALPDVSEFVSIANRRHQLRALFVRDDMDARWLPQLFERAGLRTLRNTLVHSDLTVPRRVLTAWWHGAQSELIAEGSMADDRLFVISCALERYEIPFDKMPALKSIPQAERSMFDVDEDGSYIHWPGRDIHVDLDGIRAAIDPGWRVKILAAKATHDRRYGAAIAKLRTAKGLKQSEITGLSERQVRRIEKGEGTTYESLRRLAAAHEMDTSEYLRQVAVTLKDFDSSHDEHGHKQLATA